MSLTFGAPVNAAGISVPFPLLTLGYWYIGIGAPVEADRILRDDLAIEVLTVSTESGVATSSAAVDPDTGGGTQVEMVQQGVWDVVMVDSFSSSVGCSDGVLPDTPLSAIERFFLGGPGSITRLNRGHMDGSENVLAQAMPNVVAPAGISARCIFKNVYLAVEANSGGYILFTPIVDGEVLTAAAMVVLVPYTGGRIVKRFEIPLWKDTGPNRQGLVGTWFSFLLEAMDLTNCGRMNLDGWELEYDPLTEFIPGQVFTGRSYDEPVSDPIAKWFLGSNGPGLVQGGVATDDDGTVIASVLVTNEIAPAGVGGETLFQNIYVVLIRRNALDWTFTVTPTLDGIDLQPITVLLAGVVGEVSEVLELSLAQTNGRVTYHPRGAWMSWRSEAASAPDLPVEFHGIELEYEILTESVEAVNNG